MVTALYPLAQAIQQVGGSTVSVIDVVPAGANPRTYRLGPAQIAAVDHAALAVEVGGFQPSFARGGRRRGRVGRCGGQAGDQQPLYVAGS